MDLVDLVTKVAHELRQDSRVVRAGRELSLTEVELMFQGADGDYVDATMFTGDGQINRERTLEECADVFARFMRFLRPWGTFARRHGLVAVCVKVKRFAGATTRDLYIREEPRVIPDDPMILF